MQELLADVAMRGTAPETASRSGFLWCRSLAVEAKWLASVDKAALSDRRATLVPRSASVSSGAATCGLDYRIVDLDCQSVAHSALLLVQFVDSA